MNLATHYYVKARDNYPWDLPEAIEALEYALSYDDTHAGTHCLAGRFYAEQEQNYAEAFYHFEQALVHDVNHIDTYYYYANALILYGEYAKAKKLLKHGKTVKGICISCVLVRLAMIQELKGNFCKAKTLLEKACEKSVCNEERSEIKTVLNRVNEKMGPQETDKPKKA